MRLIVDTTTGLTVVERIRDFGCMDVVIIGTGQFPMYIEVLDDEHVCVVPGKLADTLDLRDDFECRGFWSLVDSLRRKNGVQIMGDSEKIKVRVTEWLTH